MEMNPVISMNKKRNADEMESSQPEKSQKVKVQRLESQEQLERMSPAVTKNKKRKANEIDSSAGSNKLRDEQTAKAKKLDSGARVPMKIIRNEIVQRPVKAGHLLSCGQNEVGQLGFDDNIMEKTRPALVIDSSKAKVVEISAGGMHSVYLTADGSVWSFGCNDEGALGRDTSEDGSEFKPQKVDLPTDCVRIAAGDSHSAFLLSDGRVFACGSFRDSHGTMGLNMQGKQQYPVEVVPDEDFVDIKSGADHLVMLSSGGKVYTVGCAEQGQLGRVSVRSSSGESRRGKQQLLKPGLVNARILNFVDAIWTTTYCTFVRNRSNGAILGFGLNNYNQMGIITKNSETIFAPKKVPFENVKHITGGQHHTIILTNDNKCYAIGRTDYGRLGVVNAPADPITEVTVIETLAKLKVAQVECGECCSFAITDDGKVFGWGFGSNQQLGLGSDEDQLVPAQLTGVQVKDRNVLAVSSGGQHTLFIAADKASKASK